MIKLPIFILMWILMIAIKIPTALFGLIAIVLMHPYRHTPYDDLPAWTRPWANPEDWEGQIYSDQYSLPKWWVKAHGIGFKQFYQYHAIRNPANGLRSYEWLDLDVDPKQVRYKTNIVMKRYEPTAIRKAKYKTAWYFAWQGYRAGFKLIHIWNAERHLVIKMGWRVDPADATQIANELKKDASFAGKILPYRKG
jgi:hypothetical protein